jgi:hypothetical protein
MMTSKTVNWLKYPPKVYLWAGISAKGATAVVIFTGILTADILDAGFATISKALPYSPSFPPG